MRHGRILMLAVIALALCGCKATIDYSRLASSVTAALPIAEDYAVDGCQQITIAPAITVNWESDGEGDGMPKPRPTFGGGVFIGCLAQGELIEFQCHEAKTDDEKAWCEKLRLWVLKMSGEPTTPTE